MSTAAGFVLDPCAIEEPTFKNCGDTSAEFIKTELGLADALSSRAGPFDKFLV